MPSDKIVYTAMVADFWHSGHQNILNESKKLGKVIVGLLTDEAVVNYKRVPTLTFEQRKSLIEDKEGIWKIVPQKTLDYTENLRKYKPDFVTNGDDWKTGVQKETRQKVIDVLKEWNGKLVEIPYTTGISSTIIIEDFRKNGITPEQRRMMLRRLINIKPIVRVIEAHNGLSGLVAENTKANGKEFDAIWESSLTDSSSKGKPDIELVSMDSRVHTINEILEVTTKPIIVDVDTGGQIDHFKHMVRTMERLGVSAIIVEDKKFPKVNSLMEGAIHIQEDPKVFCEKIKAGKESQITEDFMIISRIESLIAGKSVEDALKRAELYIKAGTDGIMIHSKNVCPSNIFSFCEKYKRFKNKVPLVAVPTAYNQVTENELKSFGVSVVIYANHLLRSSYKAMKETANVILRNERSLDVDKRCVSVKELFELTNR